VRGIERGACYLRQADLPSTLARSVAFGELGVDSGGHFVAFLASKLAKFLSDLTYSVSGMGIASLAPTDSEVLYAGEEAFTPYQLIQPPFLTVNRVHEASCPDVPTHDEAHRLLEV
jgi:hypothetical protein